MLFAWGWRWRWMAMAMAQGVTAGLCQAAPEPALGAARAPGVQGWGDERLLRWVGACSSPWAARGRRRLWLLTLKHTFPGPAGTSCFSPLPAAAAWSLLQPLFLAEGTVGGVGAAARCSQTDRQTPAVPWGGKAAWCPAAVSGAASQTWRLCSLRARNCGAGARGGGPYGSLGSLAGVSRSGQQRRGAGQCTHTHERRVRG